MSNTLFVRSLTGLAATAVIACSLATSSVAFAADSNGKGDLNIDTDKALVHLKKVRDDALAEIKAEKAVCADLFYNHAQHPGAYKNAEMEAAFESGKATCMKKHPDWSSLSIEDQTKEAKEYAAGLRKINAELKKQSIIEGLLNQIAKAQRECKVKADAIIQNKSVTKDQTKQAYAALIACSIKTDFSKYPPDTAIRKAKSKLVTALGYGASLSKVPPASAVTPAKPATPGASVKPAPADGTHAVAKPAKGKTQAATSAEKKAAAKKTMKNSKVTMAAAGGHRLASTGSITIVLLVGALAALAAGGVLIYSRRRKA